MNNKNVVKLGTREVVGTAELEIVYDNNFLKVAVSPKAFYS
jgi:hypothetical protein